MLRQQLGHCTTTSRVWIHFVDRSHFLTRRAHASPPGLSSVPPKCGGACREDGGFSKPVLDLRDVKPTQESGRHAHTERQSVSVCVCVEGERQACAPLCLHFEKPSSTQRGARCVCAGVARRLRHFAGLRQNGGGGSCMLSHPLEAMASVSQQ